MSTNKPVCYLCKSHFSAEDKTGIDHLRNNRLNYNITQGEESIHMFDIHANAHYKKGLHVVSMDLYMLT